MLPPPVAGEQPCPAASQRSHWYANEVAPVHEPWLELATPPRYQPPLCTLTEGAVRLTGGSIATGPNAAEVMLVVPLAFVAVTSRRKVKPTSAAPGVYVAALANVVVYASVSAVHSTRAPAGSTANDGSASPLACSAAACASLSAPTPKAAQSTSPSSVWRLRVVMGEGTWLDENVANGAPSTERKIVVAFHAATTVSGAPGVTARVTRTPFCVPLLRSSPH